MGVQTKVRDRTYEEELDDKLGLFKEHFASLELVGSGGQGRVYRAMERETEDQYAAKVIPLDSWEEMDGMKREADVLKHLEHPGIPQFKAYYERENDLGSPEFVLVTEYIEGKNLSQLVEDGRRFTEDELRNIGEQCKDILDYTHERGIVHRDIKPSNIMLTPEGKVKITDWGLSKFLGQRTRTKSAGKGSIYYMAPEQIMGKAITPKTDVYGLGLTLLAAACGEERYDDIRHQKPAEDTRKLHHLGSGFKKNLEKMLREQPSSREISFLEQVEPEVKVYAEVKPLPQVVPKKIVARSSGWGFVGYMYLGCSVLWAFNGSLDLAAGDYWGIGGAACDFGLSAIWGLCAYLNVKANKH